MSRIFSIHETAEVEINEAADFYNLESPGLGTKKILLWVSSLINKIA